MCCADTRTHGKAGGDRWRTREKAGRATTECGAGGSLGRCRRRRSPPWRRRGRHGQLDRVRVDLADASTVPLPRPDNPVTWPIFPGNGPIAAGLAAGDGRHAAGLQLGGLRQPGLVKSFAKKYNCKVAGHDVQHDGRGAGQAADRPARFDVFVAPPSTCSVRSSRRKLIQPLNHSYIPNISHAWTDFAEPFYDQHWQYTVPYTIYTTGISWRKDHGRRNPYAMANPWAAVAAASTRARSRSSTTTARASASG